MNDELRAMMKIELLTQNRMAFVAGKMSVLEYYNNIASIVRNLSKEQT